jgi:hypothetical protein
MARASASSFDSSSQIRQIVGDFVTQLSALIEQDAVSRARQTILSAFAGGEGANLTVNGKRRGRPPGRRSAVLALAGVVGRKRRKAPIQLCPVPGCSNRAAPVFGMVCSKHKDLPKPEIRKFREARRAQRDKTKGKAPANPKPSSAKTRSAKTRKKAARKPPKPAKRGVRKASVRKVRLAAPPRPVVPVAPKPPVVTA